MKSSRYPWDRSDPGFTSSPDPHFGTLLFGPSLLNTASSHLLPVLNAGRPVSIVEPFSARVARDGGTLSRTSLTTLQINVGKLCNQTCTHCHVEAGPTKRRENMSAQTASRIIELVRACESLTCVDITGGAPEMNPSFRELVCEFRSRGLRVIDRSNLTILSEPGFEWVSEFLAQQRVDVVASLPCYLADNVDRQRGDGVFDRSIRGLLELNRLGYGLVDSPLRLDLVYNPTGPSLAPDQSKLQADYKRELRERFGIEFHSLLAMNNLPIKRYSKYLAKQGQLDDYMRLLHANFNDDAAANVMCRSLVSISWDGVIYDCDFNQMIDLPVGGGKRTTIWELETLDSLARGPIGVADHCYGCTAGNGSSCNGAVT